MNINKKISIAVGILSFVSVSTFAQHNMNDMKDMEMKKSAMPRFEKIDTNNDGKVTEDEFGVCRANRMKDMAESGKMAEMQEAGVKMTPPSFDDIDKDGRGYFTEKDFTAFKEKMMNDKMKIKSNKKGIKCDTAKCGGGM